MRVSSGPHGLRGTAIWLGFACSVMAPRVLWPRFMQLAVAPRILFLLDSFAYVRASWGRECYLQQVLEHLYFSGTNAIAVVLPGACVEGGDYERMYSAAARRFSLSSLSMVVVVSMGNDLIGSLRPMSVRLGATLGVLGGLSQLRRLLGDVQTSLVYGGSGATWGYAEDIAGDYDLCVGAVVSGMAARFDYVTTGATELLGVTPVDAIGHLHFRDAFASGRLLLDCIRPPRSRL